jgi:CubicO group peptidase (beta-lactamase class C family)
MEASLDRSDWLRAARLALLHRGPDGVRVEPLARDLGVTKGSFYWHFKDRRALLDALFDEWARETSLLTRAVDGVRGAQPVELVFEELVEEQHRLSLRSERGESPSDAAIFAWAGVDPAIARRANAIETERMELFRQLLGNADLADLIYYAYHGFLLRRRRVPKAAADFRVLARTARELLARKRKSPARLRGAAKHLRHLLVLAALPLIHGCTTYRILRWRDPAPDVEASIFPQRTVARASQSSPLPYAALQRNDLDTVVVRDVSGKMLPFGEYMRLRSIHAFVILRNDSIVYERYNAGMTASTSWNAFSVSKSFTSALLGIALARGDVHSLDDSITRYVPDVATNADYAGITLHHLLGMQSGFAYTRTNGSLWHDFRSSDAHFYFSSDRRASLRSMHRENPPGARWDYKDSDADLLGWVLTNARHESFAQQLEADVWQPMGAENNAYWDLDHREGLEDAAAGLTAVARDYLRFGRLYLNRGRAGDAQVIPAAWVTLSTTLDRSRAEPEVPTWWNMQHQQYWWIPMHNWDAERDFYADGSKGQRIYVNPGAKTVIVQLADDSRQDFPFRKLTHALAGERYDFPRSIAGILLGAVRNGASPDSLKNLYSSLKQRASAQPAGFTVNQASLVALARQLSSDARTAAHGAVIEQIARLNRSATP